MLSKFILRPSLRSGSLREKTEFLHRKQPAGALAVAVNSQADGTDEKSRAGVRIPESLFAGSRV